jgi:hypothetical protein
MLKTEFVALVQSKRRAEEYSASVQKLRKQKCIRKAVTGILVAAFFVASFGIVGANDLQSETVQAKETESSQHIIRYGVMETEESILTRDGNIWLLGGPEYNAGTEVRVLFDSMETDDVTDDIIIDITER